MKKSQSRNYYRNYIARKYGKPRYISIECVKFIKNAGFDGDWWTNYPMHWYRRLMRQKEKVYNLLLQVYSNVRTIRTVFRTEVKMSKDAFIALISEKQFS